MKPSEESVAKVVVAWLDALGADVYQEVVVSGGVADIVARVGVEIWIVEVKTSLSLALVCQAYERRRLCHRVFVAAPHSRNIRDVGVICESLGIGLLCVRTGDFDGAHEYYQPKVEQIVGSHRWNRRPVGLASRLQPEHKTHAKAGSVGAGGRWTPWRNTCEQLARVVRERPGITLKDAIAEIRHHYASNSGARSSLARWVKEGKVDGIEFRDGIKLHPIGGRQ